MMTDHDYAEYTRLIFANGFPGNLLYLQQRAALRIDAWKQGAREGNPVAQFFLGLCHGHDLGAPLDTLEALRLFRLSAEAGFPPAQMQLALHFEEGRDVKHDMTEALRWYT